MLSGTSRARTFEMEFVSLAFMLAGSRGKKRESHEYKMCRSFWFCGSVGRSSAHFIWLPPPYRSHTWQNSFHGSRATIVSVVRREGKGREVEGLGLRPTETGQKLIMAATLQCQRKALLVQKRKHSRATIIKILLVGSLATAGPFGFVLVQLPAFCQRLFGKLIPQKVSQTCDLKQSAAPTNPSPSHSTQLSFCPFCYSCSCCLPQQKKPDRRGISRSSSLAERGRRTRR